MSDRTREADRAQGPRTVLDPLRPAVVVRRRVYDATPIQNDVPVPRTFSTTTKAPSIGPSEEEESGPPSSINVARALASLRSDELRRVEAIVAADEAASGVKSVRSAAPSPASRREPPRAEPVPGPPAVPTLVLGKTVALSELASKMGVSGTELPATLVARGFYALTAKTVLPRDTARVIAEMYGWRVEDGPPELDEPAPVKSGVRSRIATKPNARVKAKAKPALPKPTKVKPKSTKVKANANATKVKPKSTNVKAKATKPAKRRLAR